MVEESSTGEGDPFKLYGLSKIEIEDKTLFDSFFTKSKSTLSDYTFANTFIWRDAIHLRWAIFHDCLCVFANGDGGLTLLFPPLGKGDFIAALNCSLVICDSYNTKVCYPHPVRIEYIDQDIISRFEEFNLSHMSGDYVYETDKMITLDGSKLASKRQGRNRFLRRYPDIRTEEYGSKHFDDCLFLLQTWQEQTESTSITTSSDIKRLKEIMATVEVMKHCKELDLQGMVLYSGSNIVGFTFGEYVNQDTCNILIEKTDRKYTGSANYIFSEFCRQYWAKTKWCNVGDDWGIENLAWTKQSYHPECRLEKWVAHRVY